jgi:hypothetical protein
MISLYDIINYEAPSFWHFTISNVLKICESQVFMSSQIGSFAFVEGAACSDGAKANVPIEQKAQF